MQTIWCLKVWNMTKSGEENLPYRPHSGGLAPPPSTVIYGHARKVISPWWAHVCNCDWRSSPANKSWIRSRIIDAQWKVCFPLDNRAGASAMEEGRITPSTIHNDTTRYDTLYLCSLESWRDDQLNLAHGTEKKNKEKLKTKNMHTTTLHQQRILANRQPVQSFPKYLRLFMHSLPDSVINCIILFSGCWSSTFVRTDVVTTISHERLEQSRWNLQWISNASHTNEWPL